jgi:sulfatase maturation enzyme AslB (radical SAM superfamily)
MRSEWSAIPCAVNGNALFQKVHPSLPIFSFSVLNGYILYTPGLYKFVSSTQHESIYQGWMDGTPDHNETSCHIAHSFEAQANATQSRWDVSFLSDFTPECLTVYLSNACNSNCLYCYTSSVRQRSSADSLVNLNAVLAAARLVARSCRKTNKSFKLVIHGGGEPTLHMELLKQIVDETRKIAEKHQIQWWSHIATNGIISQKQAVWLSKTFQSIGISHDGPPEIHNFQRPLKNGRPSILAVEKSINIFAQNQASFYVRTTLLPDKTHRLDEIVEYLIHHCHTPLIRVEPGYRIESPHTGFQDEQADIFVKHFLSARKRALRNGVQLLLSVVRLEELHSSYCNTLRNSLHIVPGNIATACFFASDKTSAEQNDAIIGQQNELSGEFLLDNKKIADHRLKASNIPAPCKGCICIYHCNRGCPDFCTKQDSTNKLPLPFKCRTAQLLTIKTLSEQIVNLQL